MHLILEQIDFKSNNSAQSIDNLKMKLLDKGIINEDEYNAINSSKILEFINSGLGRKIANSVYIEKEKPFCINVEIGSEKVLVQGIIDLYAMKENGDIILVDYKTDFVKDEKELVEKYQKQLELYKYALEKNYNKRVSEVYIYSLYLNKEISL